MNTTILISGATGYLGSQLLKTLVKNDYNYIVLKRSFSNTSRIQNLDEVDLIFRENSIDTIIHCATDYGRKNCNKFDIIEAIILVFSFLIYLFTLIKLRFFH